LQQQRKQQLQERNEQRLRQRNNWSTHAWVTSGVG
jgi:hypothetical protein